MSLAPVPLPWIELSVVVALPGALFISRLKNPLLAWRWGLVFTGISFGCTVLACVSFYLCKYLAGLPDAAYAWSLQGHFFGTRPVIGIDELNAPLFPVVGLLHFLTALATGRTKMRRFSLSWSLTSEAVRLATFACTLPWLLIGLLAADVIPAYVELLNRRKPTRVYLLHMGLFVGLLVFGWAGVSPRHGHETQTAWATVPLQLAVLVRCGVVPVHCWLTDWFEHASFGNALLFVAPLTGVYAAIRLVLPYAPEWTLQGIGFVSLITALYAAGMAVVQNEARRFFAYLFLSHASLVLVGLELHSALSLTGSLALWISVALSLGGFGLTIRALEARYGRLSLADFHGLYEQSPALAACFLLTGLTSVGFPGTLGFVSAEILVDGAVRSSPFVGFTMALVAAINGIAIMRAYLQLFTGRVHTSSVSMKIGGRERFAVITLTVLILLGGVLPQPGVASRSRAAEAIREHRKKLNERSDPARGQELAQEFVSFMRE
jgi:NADH-quinone oxidoreductase subunit M